MAIVMAVGILPISNSGLIVNAHGNTFGLPVENLNTKITCDINGYANHNGYDLGVPVGTGLYSMFSGTAVYYQRYVKSTGKSASYGNYVVVTSDDGIYKSYYCHLSSFNGFSLNSSIISCQNHPSSWSSATCAEIIVGEKPVSAGELLGYSGSTGNSTGPHCHIGLKVNNSFVNPDDYISFSYSATSLNSEELLSHNIGYYITNTSALNLRSGPSIGYNTILTIPYSTIVNVSETSSNWGKVIYNGKVGWICLDYATKIDDNYMSMSKMTTSESGIEFIKNQEGFRAEQYWDNNQYSIGYGSYTYNGEYPNGITEEQADLLLRSQIVKYENALRNFLISNGITLSPPQYDALVSFSYNLGANVWKSDWVILDMLRNGAENYSEAEIKSIFSRYAAVTETINGEKIKTRSKGLLARREREAILFISGMNSTKTATSAPQIISPVFENGSFPANESVLFSWTIVPGAENYSVSVKRLDGEPATEDNANENGVNIGGYFNYKTNETSVTVLASDFTAGSWYKFAVGAEFADGTSKWTFTYIKAVADTLSQVEIASPNNFSTFASGDDISFIWDTVSDADYYRYVLKELYSYPEDGNDNEAGEIIKDAKIFDNNPVNFNSEWFKVGTWYKFAVGAYTNEGISSPWDVVYFCVTDRYVETTGIDINRTSADIYEGNTVKLSAVVYPYHASDTSVTWSSADSSIASVDSDGKVTAIKSGKTVITAKTVDGYTASCDIKVLLAAANYYTVTYDANGGTVSPVSEKVEVDDFVILPTPTKEIKITFDANGGMNAPADLLSNVEFFGWRKNGTGTQKKAGAIFTPSADCTMVANWDSSAKFIIPDEAPTRTGYKFLYWKVNGASTSTFIPGQAVYFRESLELLAVWEKDDSKVYVTGVTLSESDITIPLNGEKQLSVSVTPLNADNQKVVWTSSDTAVATVSQSGLVTAISAGTSTICVTTEDGNLSSYCDVIVSGGEAKYLKFADKEKHFVLPDDEGEVIPSTQIDILTNIDSNIIWSVDNEQVAEITNSNSSYCMVLPVGAGTTTLKASVVCDGKTYYDECEIDVTGGAEKYFILSNDAVEFDFSAVEAGDPLPGITVSLNTNVAGTVTWSVSDPTVAKISNYSTDYCVIQAVNPGKTTLTVSATENGKTFSRECEINVIGRSDEYNVYISADYIELEASETGEPFGGDQSGELIIRSEPSDADIRIYVEDSTIAISGYEKRRGEDFYRATVDAVSPGETNLVAEVVYNGVTYSAKSKIKVLSPSSYGVYISESNIELEGTSEDFGFNGEESDEIIICAVPVDCVVNIYTENSSVANVGYIKKVGEDFYRASVMGLDSGETNLVAEITYGGITYSSKCKIKVVAPDVAEPVTYTISFVSNGGSSVNPITAEEGSVISAPANPTKTGYTFAGWTDVNGNSVFVPSTMPSCNVTYYAKWAVNSYTVTWVVDGESSEEAYKFGATIIEPTEPVKDGYEFEGWTPAIPDTMPAYDLTFTAVWEEIISNTCPYCNEPFASEAECNSHMVNCPSKPVTPPAEDDNQVTIVVRNPSTTTISYGDAIILHADVTGTLPAGAKIKWESSNGNFVMDVSADGTTCKISPSSKGDTTFTVSVVDANENVISSDEQVMTSKAGFFDKIIAFFKKLFGLTKTIPQIYKGIF